MKIETPAGFADALIAAMEKGLWPRPDVLFVPADSYGLRRLREIWAKADADK